MTVACTLVTRWLTAPMLIKVRPGACCSLIIAVGTQTWGDSLLARRVWHSVFTRFRLKLSTMSVIHSHIAVLSRWNSSGWLGWGVLIKALQLRCWVALIRDHILVHCSCVQAASIANRRHLGNVNRRILRLRKVVRRTYHSIFRAHVSLLAVLLPLKQIRSAASWSYSSWWSCYILVMGHIWDAF